MLSEQTRAIVALIADADDAIAAGDFGTARDIQSYLASGTQMERFGAEIVGMAIERARERRDAA